MTKIHTNKQTASKYYQIGSVFGFVILYPKEFQKVLLNFFIFFVCLQKYDYNECNITPDFGF